MQRDGEKLCLGTVQFGQCYGIKNERHRQPTQEECFAILDAAQARGIRYLDTASVYGTSEDVLGAYVRARASTSFRICSKLRPDDTVRSAEEET
ncbi:aldo/keto reductase, partial [Selenomonas sp.]